MIPMLSIIGLSLKPKDLKNIKQSYKYLLFSCPVTFYCIPNTKSKRSTSFGNGSRTSFMLTTDAPSSYLYNSTSDFTYNK